MSDEKTQASPYDAYDQQPPTQDFPAYQPAQAAPHPGEPSWATAAAVARPRRRRRALLAISIAMSVALVLTLPAAALVLTPVGDWLGVSLERTDRAAAAQAEESDGDGAGGAGTDLRESAVFLQTNDPGSNAVVAFARNNEDGTLREVGRFPTGGVGSGSFEDTAQGLVLGTSNGETAPIHNVDKAELLFVVNAGSNTVSTFRVNADGLELAAEVPSGGEKPISLTVNRGLLYVLNSGEFDDRLFLGPEMPLENCTHGQLPSVTGFRVAPDGGLTQIDGSTRLLTGEAESGCAQVSFSPDGKTLIVTERIAGLKDETGRGKGAIVTFPVRQDGTLGPIGVIEPTGNGPYGFTFTRDGALLTVEQNGAFNNPAGGNVATYTPGGDGTLKAVGGSVRSFGTDTCWIVLAEDKQLAFASAPFDGGSIASFSLGKDGTLTLLHSAASANDGKDVNADYAAFGSTDLSLSRDAKYLYQLNSFVGMLYVFLVNSNGTLSFIEQHEVFNLKPLGAGGEAAPFGIAAF